MQRKLRRDAFSAMSCLYQVSLFYTLRKSLWGAATKNIKHLGDLEHFEQKHLGDLELVCIFVLKISKL